MWCDWNWSGNYLVIANGMQCCYNIYSEDCHKSTGSFLSDFVVYRKVGNFNLRGPNFRNFREPQPKCENKNRKAALWQLVTTRLPNITFCVCKMQYDYLCTTIQHHMLSIQHLFHKNSYTLLFEWMLYMLLWGNYIAVIYVDYLV